MEASTYDSKFVSVVAQLLLKNSGMIYGDFVINNILQQAEIGSVPPRIDVCMMHSSKNDFIRECHCLSMKVVADDGGVVSFGPGITQRCYNVSLDPDYWRQMSARFAIQLDVSTMEEQCRDVVAVEVWMTNTAKKEPEPFFKTLDFECNSLYLTDAGLLVSTQVEFATDDVLGRHKALIRIIDDVLKLRTKLMFSCHHTMQAKARKLMEGGWTIYDDTITSINDDTYTGVCLLCHDEVPALHFKLQCCNARYHADCLKASIEHGYTNQCNMCRSPLLLDDIHYVVLNGDNMA